MKHRHLEYPSGSPVEDLPAAVIADILQRGDLAHWRPIAAAVARDPDGPFARRVMRLLDAYPSYGTSPLWRAWIDRRRACGSGELVPLATLRRRLGLTQEELAARIGMSQSDLSKLERRRDVRVSTLRSYVEALGGRLRLLAGTTEIRIGAARATRRRGARSRG